MTKMQTNKVRKIIPDWFWIILILVSTLAVVSDYLFLEHIVIYIKAFFGCLVLGIIIFWLIKWKLIKNQEKKDKKLNIETDNFSEAKETGIEKELK